MENRDDIQECINDMKKVFGIIQNFLSSVNSYLSKIDNSNGIVNELEESNDKLEN